MMNIAIIGHGFVGAAVDYGFPDTQCKKYIIDPKLGTSIDDLRSVKIDFAFVCVPTPMGNDGAIDASIITNVVQELKQTIGGIIIIKSTITPDIIQNLFYGVDRARMVYNPEFLTEKSANEDFVNPFMHVFGGFPETTAKVEYLYKYYSLCKPCSTYHMSPMDASFVKYGINSYLASKVLWFNQFYDTVNTYGANYGKVVSAITTDDRIGRSHTTVPGYDGRRGFGGSCFSKDIPAFIYFARSINKDFTVLEEVAKRNQEYRNSYGELSEREKEQNIRFDHKF